MYRDFELCGGHCCYTFRHRPSSFNHALEWVYIVLIPTLLYDFNIFCDCSLHVHYHGLGKSRSTSDGCVVRSFLLLLEKFWILLQFPSVGVCWWDFVQYMALLCLPSFKVAVLFTVSDFPCPVFLFCWFICIGASGCHGTRVRSLIEGCTEYRLILPQLPYVPNLDTYVFLSELTVPVSPSYSEQAKYIRDWYCRKCYLFLLAFWLSTVHRDEGVIGGWRIWYDLFSFLRESYFYLGYYTVTLTRKSIYMLSFSYNLTHVTKFMLQNRW